MRGMDAGIEENEAYLVRSQLNSLTVNAASLFTLLKELGASRWNDSKFSREIWGISYKITEKCGGFVQHRRSGVYINKALLRSAGNIVSPLLP